MYEYVRLLAATSPEQIEKSEVETPFLEFDYKVGDIITAAPESRDMLACRSDNRSKNRIVRVKMDFQNQSTKLNIIRNRIL